MPPGSNFGTRDIGLDSHGAGKGDKERSLTWRNGYDDINWHRPISSDGFVRKGARLVKRYPAKPVITSTAPVGEPLDQLLQDTAPKGKALCEVFANETGSSAKHMAEQFPLPIV